MATLSAIREALRVRLATIAGLNAYAKAPGQPVMPAAIVLPGQILFDEAMTRGVYRHTYSILVLVSQSTTDLAQEHLDAYLDDSGSASIKAAIEGDEQLTDLVSFTRVMGVSQYGDIEYAGATYLGARFAVDIGVDPSS